MGYRMGANSHGKGQVRLTKLIRHADRHEIRQLTVEARLHGRLDDAYLSDDNRQVLPTDTIKNTVYAIAAEHPLDSIESFGLTLSAHFMAPPRVTRVEATVYEHKWERLTREGRPAHHTFLGSDTELKTTRVDRDEAGARITSGLKNLIVLNTTASGFSNFLRDDYTTLKDTDDRILATNIEATWPYRGAEVDFEAARAAIRGALIDVFADTFSPSVQHTLWLMGRAALAACPHIDSLTLRMPNIHNIPFDLEPLGLDNRNEIFVATSEPYGLIEGTVERE